MQLSWRTCATSVHRNSDRYCGRSFRARPPVVAAGSPVASGQAVSADLGTTTRAGGIMQLTHESHLLHYSIKDKDGGDSYGEGVPALGAGWYVVAPSGKKVDNS